ADDFADEPQYNKIRLRKLNEWHAALTHCEYRNLNNPVFMALANTRNEIDIPIKLFEDLLLAFKMDVVKHEYDHFADLLYYCQHSANPIGRIVLYLFGYQPEKDAELFLLSDDICTGLQLTNFWQDVSID